MRRASSQAIIEQHRHGIRRYASHASLTSSQKKGEFRARGQVGAPRCIHRIPSVSSGATIQVQLIPPNLNKIPSNHIRNLSKPPCIPSPIELAFRRPSPIEIAVRRG
jgi:hypothetical protein